MRAILTAWLAMIVTASASAQQAPPAAAPGSATSTISTATPSVIATGTAAPPLGGSGLLPNGGTGMLPYGSNGCNCCLGCKQRGSLCRVLLAWATYCPKNRIGIIQECNTCRYKGALPFYPFFGRGCQEGAGMPPTLAPDMSCHGHHGCARCSNGCK